MTLTDVCQEGAHGPTGGTEPGVPLSKSSFVKTAPTPGGQAQDSRTSQQEGALQFTD